MPTAQIMPGAEETCGEALHWAQEQSYYLTNGTFEATSKFSLSCFLKVAYVNVTPCQNPASKAKPTPSSLA